MKTNQKFEKKLSQNGSQNPKTVNQLIIDLIEIVKKIEEINRNRFLSLNTQVINTLKKELNDLNKKIKV